MVPIGCAETGWDEDKEEFSEAFGAFNTQFGSQQESIFDSTECESDNPKADGFGFLPEPCDLLAPLMLYGDDAIRSGFLVGVEGETALGPSFEINGFDIVWDLYHQQMTVSHYSGSGLGQPVVGTSVSAYVGFVMGFEHGVGEWDGFFATTGLEVGFPYLEDFASVNPGAFVTAEDLDGSGSITPGEIVPPPQGLYGYTLGAQLGFTILPELAPIGGSVAEGYWAAHKAAIRQYYDDFRRTEIFFTTPMIVRLVDHHDGSPCPENWPEEKGDRDCVIEFGDVEDSFIERSINTAYSICRITTGCTTPMSWSVTTMAIAIAALRDHGANFASFCPDHVTGNPAEQTKH